MPINWTQVTVDHVRAACDQYDAGSRPKRPAQSTFLIFDGKQYPAKFIRGLAYKIANGAELDPSREYAGGMETVRFFSKLGLATEHKAKVRGPSAPTPLRSKEDQTDEPGRLPQQKQALLKLLKDRYGTVELEAKFPWLIVPEPHDMSPYIRDIFQALQRYRGFSDFATPGFELRCDFVVPSKNLIIEYDERQHFTEPRAIALDRYPAGLQLGFDVQRWADECRRVKATDPTPPYRDEQRAYYDSLRDILSAENGYIVVRIREGDQDWASPDAGKTLDGILPGHASSTDQETPEPSSSDIEVLRSYLSRSKDNWYWEEPIEDVLQSSNRNLLNPIGKKIRELAGKRWRETQFTDTEIEQMAVLIRSEADRIGVLEPPPNLVPTESPITEEALHRLHSEPDIKKIALVSHNYKLPGGDGLLGYADCYEQIARICEEEGCDTILFALWTWDGRSLVTRTHDTLFDGLSILRRVILEAGDLEAHSGQPAADDLGIEIWLKDGDRPFVVRQKFVSAPSVGVGREYMNNLACRQIGTSLLLVCGESSIVTADSFGLTSALDRMRIKVLLNPVHTYMRPRGSNDYHSKRLAMASESGRTAISVWNHGRYRTEPDPWRVFHDGAERSNSICEIKRPVPEQPNLRIGIIDVPNF